MGCHRLVAAFVELLGNEFCVVPRIHPETEQTNLMGPKAGTNQVPHGLEFGNDLKRGVAWCGGVLNLGSRLKCDPAARSDGVGKPLL